MIAAICFFCISVCHILDTWSEVPFWNVTMTFYLLCCSRKMTCFFFFTAKPIVWKRLQETEQKHFVLMTFFHQSCTTMIGMKYIFFCLICKKKNSSNDSVFYVCYLRRPMEWDLLHRPIQGGCINFFLCPENFFGCHWLLPFIGQSINEIAWPECLDLHSIFISNNAQMTYLGMFVSQLIGQQIWQKICLLST